MTLKHINLVESEVFRNLERIVGLPDPTVEDIVKSASFTKESYNPSDDLFNDIICLASGLRSKGFTAEADELENKVFAFKKSEKELDTKLLEEAHPEGDVEVGESKGGYGKVLTEQSAHKKILEVVNKVPSGKYASLNKNILNAVEMVLDVKIAQEMPNIDQIKHNLYNLILSILQTEDIDNVMYRESDTLTGDSWFAFDTDEATHIATKMAPEVLSYLEQQAKQGYDPVKLFDIMQYQIKRHYNQDTTGKWFDLDNDWFDIGYLFDALKAGIIPLTTLTEEYKEKQRAGNIGYDELERRVINQLDGLVALLLEFSNDSQKPNDKRIIARQNADEFRYISNALKSFKYRDSVPFNEIISSIAALNYDKVPDKAKYQTKSFIELVSFIDKQKRLVNKFIGEFSQKAGEFLEKVFKLGALDETDESVDKYPKQLKDVPSDTQSRPPTGPVVPPAGAADIKAMQSALVELGNALKKSQSNKKEKADVISFVGGKNSPNTPDGIWGGNTIAALKAADEVRQEVKSDKPINHSTISSVAAKSNTEAIKAIIDALSKEPVKEKIKTKDPLDLGTYFSPHDNPVKFYDINLMSLERLQAVLEDTGVIGEFIAGAPVKEQQKPSPVSTWKTTPEMTTETSYKQLEKVVFGQEMEWKPVTPHPSNIQQKPSSIKTEQAKPNEKWVQPGPGLTFWQWQVALKHFKDEAMKEYQRPDNPNKHKASFLYKKLDEFQKQLVNELQQQKITQTDVVDVSQPQFSDKEDYSRGSSRDLGRAPGRAPGRAQGRSKYYMDKSGQITDSNGNVLLRSDIVVHLTDEDINNLDDIVPPFSSVIDLNRDVWDMPYKFYLVYKDFRHAPAISLAGRMFGGNIDDIKNVQEKIMDHLGVKPLAFNDSWNSYMIKYKDPKKPFPLVNHPEYERLNYLYQSADSARQFQRFLAELASQISRVLNEWSGKLDNPNVRDQLIPPTSKSADIWLQIIRIKHKEITEWIKSGGKK